MADTNTTTTSSPSVKKYYDYAQQQVDEQAILDKYNAATMAQYNIQREQNRAAENQFYNQMYNTQKTAMDTIRQANANAVATGASRGVQAANELSAILGLQQESVDSATELAQASRQTSQEETAAVLENVLNAYNQAVQERQQLVSQGIEAASVDAQEQANQIEAMNAESTRMQAEASLSQAEAQKQANEQTQRDALQSAAQTGFSNYLAELANQGKDYSKGYSDEGAASLEQALASLTNTVGNFSWEDWKGYGNGTNRANQMEDALKKVCQTYGIDYSSIKGSVDSLKSEASDSAWWGGALFGKGKRDKAEALNNSYGHLISLVKDMYQYKQNKK